VYTSKNIKKIFELLERDDEDTIQKLIDEDKVSRYPAEDFTPDLIKDLEHDLDLLKKLRRCGVILIRTLSSTDLLRY